jgi:hypothetical protein
VPPAGPVLSLLLIGLILLSGLLYYRAIKIQRFLEPALALSQPRNEFTKRINLLFQSEFSANPVKGLQVRMGSIVMHRSALFLPDNKMRPEGKTMLKKLARIFLALMEDPQARSGISRIMIMAPFESHELQGANVHQRMNSHVLVGFIQDALFYEEPRLGSLYAKYFATGTQPLGPGEKDDGTVNFIIMPSEYLHIKVLESLEKYSY